jgi:hypothetical protein
MPLHSARNERFPTVREGHDITRLDVRRGMLARAEVAGRVAHVLASVSLTSRPEAPRFWH